jgi:hypothetical protein
MVLHMIALSVDVTTGAVPTHWIDPRALIGEAWERCRRRRILVGAVLMASVALAGALYLGIGRSGPAGTTSGQPTGSATPVGLGLAQLPYVGVTACRGQANVTTCGRVGIAVWVSHHASEVDASLGGARVRLQPPPNTGPSASWRGFVHLPLASMGLPSSWFGTPAKTLTLRLRIRYGSVWRHGHLLVPLSPGWG